MIKRNKKLLSIILPAHNEEELISQVCADIRKVCSKLDLGYQLIVVENGSRDNTWELVKQAALKDKNILPLQVSPAGYGTAMLAGIKKVTTPYALIFNVDFWDERFINLAKVDLLGYDIINSSKLLPGSNDNRPFSRKAVTFIYNKFINLFLGYRGTDTHGIKLMRMSAVAPVIKQIKTTSGIVDSELMIRGQRKGLKILELPVSIEEIRPVRFTISRWLQTPKDIFELMRVLQK